MTAANSASSITPDGRFGVPPNVFIARQAILDRTQQTWGYQLLFRDGPTNRANIQNAHQATSTVILNAVLELGLDRTVGDHVTVLEFPRQTLLEYYSVLLPSDRVVLQVSANIGADIQVCAAVRYLRDQGYRVALNNFDFRYEGHPLLDLCDFVKLDVSKLRAEHLRQSLDIFRDKRCQKIAVRVGTQALYEQVRASGFDYFQGFYLCQPQMIEAHSTNPQTALMTELLAAVHKDEIDHDALEELIVRDVNVSYRLLRCLNSAAFSLPRKVESVRQALVMLGQDNLRKWVSMLAFMANDDTPDELVRIAMVRGQMCSLLSSHAGLPSPSKAFTVGLLSVLPALLDKRIEEVLAELPLSEDVAAAIREREGRLGKVLACVEAHEAGDWDHVALERVSTEQISASWFDAVLWADETVAT